MKRSFLMLTLVFTLSDCSPKNDDPEILKKILTDYFDGIKTKDLNKLNSVTTTDFILYEDGKIWTNDSLVRVNPKFRSVKGTWTFDNMKVNIDESSGDAVYYNHGDFVINDTIHRQVDWLESATFRKVDGEWKMNFLHSTVRKK
ncbi:MAG TPA: nuclear transport factor 2 family protein [Ohtaekwangia sp.]